MNLFTPQRDRSRQTLRNLVAMLCVVLLLFVGAAQVLHSHPGGETTNPECSLCAVAHVTPLPEPVLGAIVVAEAVRPVAVEDPVSAPSRPVTFSTYVRPPPALTAHA